MKPILYILSIFSIISFLYACGGDPNDPFSKCKYGKPQPIFEGTYTNVDSQRFEINGMEGVEQVWFENGMQMELLQQGCDKVRQTFHFKLPGTFETGENWIMLAASQFEYISSISERHFELGMWGQAIQQNNKSLFIGEKIMLEPGFSVKIDKVSGGDYAIVIVELSED